MYLEIKGEHPQLFEKRRLVRFVEYRKPPDIEGLYQRHAVESAIRILISSLMNDSTNG